MMMTTNKLLIKLFVLLFVTTLIGCNKDGGVIDNRLVVTKIDRSITP